MAKGLRFPTRKYTLRGTVFSQPRKRKQKQKGAQHKGRYTELLLAIVGKRLRQGYISTHFCNVI